MARDYDADDRDDEDDWTLGEYVPWDFFGEESLAQGTNHESISDIGCEWTHEEETKHE